MEGPLKGITRKVRERKAIVQDIKEYNFEQRKRYESTEYNDGMYGLPDDVDLTPEQEKIIKDYWKRYEFAINPPMIGFKTYYNRTGMLDPRFITYRFRNYFSEDFAPEKYRYAFQDKAYLPKIFSHGRQPRTIIRKINRIILDTDYNKISIDRGSELCAEFLEQGGEIVIKANSSSGGGNSLVFIKDKTAEEISDILKKYKGGYSVQEAIVQHPVMASLNASTVNTIRLVTYIVDDEVVPMAALIKVGNASVRVDNYKHGGHMIGIDINTGRTLDWALDINYNKVKTLPSGTDLSDNGIKVPFFNDVLKTAIACHYEIPKIRMIGWDIAVDKDGPVIVEDNFSCDFRMHQVLTGPVFGEYTDGILDELILGRFSKPGLKGGFSYDEYYDHIAINKYVGFARKLNVPSEINGKPVTRLESDTFLKNRTAREIIVPDSVKSMGTRVFYGCDALRRAVLPKGIKRLPKETFAMDINLTEVENMDKVTYVGARCFYHCEKFKGHDNVFVQV